MSKNEAKQYSIHLKNVSVATVAVLIVLGTDIDAYDESDCLLSIRFSLEQKCFFWISAPAARKTVPYLQIHLITIWYQDSPNSKI